MKPNNPLAPKLDIDGGKHVLACFWTKNYLEWIIKQLLNEAEYHLKNYGDRGGCNQSQPTNNQ